ncbi:Hypothetical_protein [Hexamita inflata]|uniref:Hypothetical_protein n=1 Tax=Hexamita inflata TaxID=28002 RepID=A0ABP1HQM3_9EUKA
MKTFESLCYLKVNSTLEKALKKLAMDFTVQFFIRLQNSCKNNSFSQAHLRSQGNQRRIPLPEMRLGQIGCGRQNPPIQNTILKIQFFLKRLGLNYQRLNFMHIQNLYVND